MSSLVSVSSTPSVSQLRAQIKALTLAKVEAAAAKEAAAKEAKAAKSAALVAHVVEVEATIGKALKAFNAIHVVEVPRGMMIEVVCKMLSAKGKIEAFAVDKNGKTTDSARELVSHILMASKTVRHSEPTRGTTPTVSLV